MNPSTRRTKAVIMCMIIPTIGMIPMMEVIIPRSEPKENRLSYMETIKVTVWTMNINNKGVQRWEKINNPPKKGMPKKASMPPDMIFKKVETTISTPSNQKCST